MIISWSSIVSNIVQVLLMDAYHGSGVVLHIDLVVELRYDLVDIAVMLLDNSMELALDSYLLPLFCDAHAQTSEVLDELVNCDKECAILPPIVTGPTGDAFVLFPQFAVRFPFTFPLECVPHISHLYQPDIISFNDSKDWISMSLEFITMSISLNLVIKVCMSVYNVSFLVPLSDSFPHLVLSWILFVKWKIECWTSSQIL